MIRTALLRRSGDAKTSFSLARCTVKDGARVVEEYDLRLTVVKWPQAKNGFVERSFGWTARFCRQARGQE